MTTTERLLRILREYRALAGIETPAEELAEGAPFRVADTQFHLQLRGELLAAFADLGPAPAGREAEVYELLLRSNTMLGGTLLPLFGMQVGGHNLVALQNLPMAVLDARGLDHALHSLEEMTMVWRLADAFPPVVAGALPGGVPAAGRGAAGRLQPGMA